MRFVFALFIMVLVQIDVVAQSYGNEWIDFEKTYYKFPVREQRFYRIPYTTLNAAGLAGTPVGQFQLWRDGKEVPLFTSVNSGTLPTNGFIEFFGKPNTGVMDTELFQDPAYHTNPDRSFFNDTAWYFLTINPAGGNKRFTDVPNFAPADNQLPDSFYMQTANPLAGTLGFNYGFSRVISGQFFYSSNWDAGEGFSSGYFNGTGRNAEFNLTGLRAFTNGPPPKIIYAIAGNTDASRMATLSINNVPFDSVQVNKFELKFGAPDNLSMGQIINDGINFKFYSNNTIWFENVTVNQCLFTYPRKFFHNQQNPLEIKLPSNLQGNNLRVAGLPNGNIAPIIYDFTNLSRYIGSIKPDSSLFLLQPSEVEREIVVGTQVAAHLRNITQLRQVKFRDFTKTINQGNYLIISHALLRQGTQDNVEAYRSYRSSNEGGNYNALIYDMDELADQFAYGVRKHPLAIRRFIFFALDKFQAKPKMVFLIGRGTTYFEYYRFYFNGAEILNTVPTWGFPGSDNMFAARSYTAPFPEIPIGRLAAVNSNEIKVYFEKIKDFELLQRKTPILPSENEWRKRAIHLLGGEVEADANLFRPFLTQAGNIYKDPKMGAIVDQFERLKNPNFAKQMKFIEDRISQGVSTIYFFGHSSSSSIDFNLNSPEQFAFQKGKYPIFIANGCYAGNIFSLNSSRLSTKEVTASDNFIFAPSSGSVAFLSNSHIGAYNYLNRLSLEFYKAASLTFFGKSIGEIQREALRRAYVTTPSADQFNRWNIEQNILHGDPALVLFPAAKPDFAVEASLMETIPQKTITELDSIDLKIQYFNLGQAITDSVLIRVERELPDGTSRMLFNEKIANVFNHDSLTIRMGLKGLFEEGNGFFVARIDPANDFDEVDKDNNVAVLPFLVERSYIKPVFPYNYSIVNTPKVILKASTTDPIQALKGYRFQVDTTTLFNSPLFEFKDTFSVGGAIEWAPAQNLLPNTVYYWKAGLASGVLSGTPEIFSFIYIPGTKVGFNQSHFFQHQSSDADQMVLRASRDWIYDQKLQNIYAAQGIYPSSGTEDTHFSITVNGEMKIRSACIGQSIIFNLFDSASFASIPNTPEGLYGSAGICGPGRENNFEFKYFNHTNRKKIVDFINGIPKGQFVAARLVVDPPYDSLQVRYWMRDTLIYGSGNSLYHTLKNQGFYDLDSLNRTRTFFFMFRKDDSTLFKPVSRFSQGLSDRVYASVFPTTLDTLGTLSSPWMGPAKNWNELEWKSQRAPGENVDPNTRLQIWGRTEKGLELKLQDLNGLEHIYNLDNIDPTLYPYVQLRMQTSGTYASVPAQLSYWRVYFEPLPDGALSSKDWFKMDRNILKPDNDTLKLELAFKNVSDYYLDSTDVKVTLVDAQGTSSVFYTTRLKPLNGGDTAILNIHKYVSFLQGEYLLLIEVNEKGNPREQYYFNNRSIIPFTVDGGTLPIHLLTFDAKYRESKVDLTWKLAQDDQIDKYQVEHSRDGRSFETLGIVKQSPGRMGNYAFDHLTPAMGNNFYRLRIIKTSGEGYYSELKKVVIASRNAVRIAPNPFTQYFTLQPLDNTVPWQIRIMDAGGKMVLVDRSTGGKRIDMGNQPTGMYWVEWVAGDEKQIIQIVKQ